jgi:glycosyltransferase involved in cell wall biosynthesis
MIRLGGFVIHGDNLGTLARCLDSLRALSDTCVAVDSGSRDGSAELVRERGIPRLPRRWEGYGAARAAAVEALQGCDYLFFLDSDEWLEPEAVAALQAWKGSAPRAPHYSLGRRDWAQLGGRRFLYRTERHVRLVRRDAALWDRRMIVHEALPPAETVRLPVMLEHSFADDLGSMRTKVERYALLWAIRFRLDRRPAKPPLVQHVAHLLRETLLKGSVFRGGLRAVGLADAVAYHHARKYALLQEVRRGAHAELVEAFERDRLEDLFRLLKAQLPGQGAAAGGAPLRPPVALPTRAELAGASLGLRRQD